MDTISIQIPAKLFAAIYARHKEDTGNVINECLSNLLHENEDDSSPGAGTQHFMRPGKGTITGRVWEIADEVYAKTGGMNREAVVTACMEEDIKMNTANTQYSHWQKAMKESGGDLK